MQSITFDEANTHHWFVAPGWSSVWDAASNNHVLNSLMIQVFVRLFGLSHLTMRAPALLGGAIYVLAACRLCALLTRELAVAGPLFVCFVFNPFVMDYFVAARGYGLAIGFFTLALWYASTALIRQAELTERQLFAHSVQSSVCAALSICANFSFAYANLMLVATALVWSCARLARPALEQALRLGITCFLSAAAVVFAITGPVLFNLPKRELYWGTNSLGDMWRYIYNASFPSLPLHFHPAMAAAPLAGLIVLVLQKRPPIADSRGTLRLSVLAAVVLALTILAHWLQFKLLKIPLPLDRTSLFILPLVMVICGGALAAHRHIRLAGILVLTLSAVYYLGALRDSYFQEWRLYGADARAAFPIIVDASRRAGVRQVPVDWKYAPSLNFYRILNRTKEIQEFYQIDPDRMPQGKALYVLPWEQYETFLRGPGMREIYRGPIGGMTVVAATSLP